MEACSANTGEILMASVTATTSTQPFRKESIAAFAKYDPATAKRLLKIDTNPLIGNGDLYVDCDELAHLDLAGVRSYSSFIEKLGRAEANRVDTSERKAAAEILAILPVETGDFSVVKAFEPGKRFVAFRNNSTEEMIWGADVLDALGKGDTVTAAVMERLPKRTKWQIAGMVALTVVKLPLLFLGTSISSGDIVKNLAQQRVLTSPKDVVEWWQSVKPLIDR